MGKRWGMGVGGILCSFICGVVGGRGVGWEGLDIKKYIFDKKNKKSIFSKK
mgnify:CR=1 FL=1